MALTVAEFFCSFCCWPVKLFCSELTELFCFVCSTITQYSVHWTIPVLSVEPSLFCLLNHPYSVCWTIPVLSVEPYLFCKLNHTVLSVELPPTEYVWNRVAFLCSASFAVPYFKCWTVPLLCAIIYYPVLSACLYWYLLFLLLSCSACWTVSVLSAELILFCLLNFAPPCWVALFCLVLMNCFVLLQRNPMLEADLERRHTRPSIQVDKVHTYNSLKVLSHEMNILLCICDDDLNNYYCPVLE